MYSYVQSSDFEMTYSLIKLIYDIYISASNNPISLIVTTFSLIVGNLPTLFVGIVTVKVLSRLVESIVKWIVVIGAILLIYRYYGSGAFETVIMIILNFLSGLTGTNFIS